MNINPLLNLHQPSLPNPIQTKTKPKGIANNFRNSYHGFARLDITH